MNSYILLFVTDDDGALEYITLEGENLLNAFINHIKEEEIKEEESDFFKAAKFKILEENNKLTNEEVAQVLFYDLYFEAECYPYNILTFNTTQKVSKITEEEITESWDNRPGATSFTKNDLIQEQNNVDTNT